MRIRSSTWSWPRGTAPWGAPRCPSPCRWASRSGSPRPCSHGPGGPSCGGLGSAPDPLRRAGGSAYHLAGMDPGDIMSRTWALYRAHWQHLIAIAAVIYVPIGAVSALLAVAGWPGIVAANILGL